jgi:two-component system, OmpR family, response regulator MprA
MPRVWNDPVSKLKTSRKQIVRFSPSAHSHLNLILPGYGGTVNGSEGAGARLLVVDDEPALREALRSSLEFEGYAVETVADGLAALDRLEREPYAAVLLDVMMPRLDGLTTCRRLRAGGNHVPVLMLTARDAVGDRVSGLDAGADDYLVKPFELDELFARVRALLRRGALAVPPESADGVLAFEDLRMDTAAREVTRAGRRLDLTRTEYLLLELFLVHPRQVLTREQLLADVWGFDFERASNSLDVYIMYLRRKTEAGGLPRLIHNVRGFGFVLRASP